MSEPPRTPAGAQNLPRRFYKVVSVEADAEAPYFRVLLDGRAMRTPAKAVFRVPGRDLAEAIAAEWAAQGTHIDPARMPMTRIANATIDGVAARHAEVVADICSYAGSDLVCYQAENPAALVARQQQAWDPVLAWAQVRLGTRPEVARGIMHVSQPDALSAASAGFLKRLDAFQLAGVHVVTTLTGSALIALALFDGALTPEAAWEAAHVDEDFQIEQWGQDSEAHRRRIARHSDFKAACVFLYRATDKTDVDRKDPTA